MVHKIGCFIFYGIDFRKCELSSRCKLTVHCQYEPYKTFVSAGNTANGSFGRTLCIQRKENTAIHGRIRKLFLYLIYQIKLFYWKYKWSWSLQAQRFIHDWTSRWFLLFHFPEPWSVNYCSGLCNDLVARVLKLDLLRRARTRLFEYS